MGADVPKVSVCVITYNHARYLAECLQGILDQKTDFPFEVIVGDDCSTDGTQDILRDFAARYPDIIRPIYQPVNTGGTQNYLDVHAAAQGDLVAHLDGDDLMFQGKLARQYEEFKKDQQLSVCWHAMDRFDEFGVFERKYQTFLIEYPQGKVTLPLALRFGSPGVHSSMMYRRRNWPNDLPSMQIMDLLISWRLLERGHGVILKDYLGAYRVGNGLSSKRRIANRILNADYAAAYLKRTPMHSQSIFLFSATGLIYDLIKRYPSWKNFKEVAKRSWSFASLLVLAPQLIIFLRIARANKRTRSSPALNRSKK